MAPFYDTVEQVESRGNQNAVSPKGARGVMQLMPGTMRDPGFGVTPPRDNSEAENRRAGREYLDAMHNRYGDPKLALMAYNWGPGSVDKWIKNGSDWNRVPTETKNYVQKIMGGKMAGNTSAPEQNQPVLMLGPSKPPVLSAPTLAANPNAPEQIQQQPVLTQANIEAAFAPQQAVSENSTAMQQLRALEGNVDANVRAKQAALLGPEAAQFAQQNNLAFSDPRVLEMAAKRNVNPLQKGLSILQGIIGTPLGIIGNALGENIDYTSAFTPEKTYRTRAQMAIAALDEAGLKAKAEIAGMRQDTRQSIFTAIQPAVSQAYQTAGKVQEANIGDNLEEQMINDTLRKNGFVDQFGNVDRSSPQAQNFILNLKQQLAMAENSGKPDPNAGIAAALTGLTTAFTKGRDDKWGDLDAKWQSDTLIAAQTAAGQINTAESLLSASRRLGDVNYGGIAGDVKRELQSSLAALGYKSDDLSNAAVVDGLVTQQALPRMQQLGGNDSEKELTMVTNSLGGSKATFAARETAQLANLATLKAQKEYGDIFLKYVDRVGRNSANQMDFMRSPEYKEFTQKKLFQFEPRMLPSLARLDPKRYQNFALVNGQVYVKTGNKAVPITSLSQEQINRAVGN
jgi:soluble lytic murein transglycosylase-like protein